MEDKQTEIKIDVSSEVLRGVYSNSILIQHTGGEFLFDFMTVFPPKGILSSRVIISPIHAKRFLKALADNLDRYETKFGKILEDQVPPAIEKMN